MAECMSDLHETKVQFFQEPPKYKATYVAFFVDYSIILYKIFQKGDFIMGGSVNVLVRFSNNEKKAFRIHTSQLENFEIPLFLDETKFKSDIMSNYYHGEPDNKEEHDDYYSKKTYFSPYAYGALFFDMKEKKIYSNNSYSGFLSLLCISLIPCLTQIIHSSKTFGRSIYEQKEILEGYNDDNEIVVLDTYTIFEEPSKFYTDFYLINNALKNDWIIKVNDHVINHDGDFVNFMNLILGKDVIAETNSSYDGMNWEIIPELRSNFENCIDLIPKGWDIIQGDGSPEYVNTLFEYMVEQKILSDEEISHWKDYLKKND